MNTLPNSQLLQMRRLAKTTPVEEITNAVLSGFMQEFCIDEVAVIKLDQGEVVFFWGIHSGYVDSGGELHLDWEADWEKITREFIENYYNQYNN